MICCVANKNCTFVVIVSEYFLRVTKNTLRVKYRC